MFSLAKSTALLAGLFALSFAGLAAAQNLGPQIVIPEDPGSGADAGCYRVDGDLYGPYTMSFCLGSSNSQKRYQVIGGGLECNGRLDWYRGGSGRLQINLRQASCGQGKAWSADTMTCNFGVVGPPNTLGGGGNSPQIVIPDRPNYGSVLRCTYDPSVPGAPSSQVTAHRIG